MKPAIRIENLSKQYRIGRRAEGYRTLRESIMEGVGRLWPFGKNGGRHDGTDGDTLWALKDVSFEVKPGQVVGVIGRNGAGKSTLLKILSRTVEPTAGRVEIRGRMSSLLEVGTGFHPELTGRENIYLNGSILGMSRREITRKFDEIVAFSEIEQFLDTPVKRYSSGMYVRLAFAVAAHLDPEILIVDEVLAVGDSTFQRKCLGKMSDVARSGRTILFVSHNMAAIQNLCDRAALLVHGAVEHIGAVEEGVAKYLQEGSCLGDAEIDLTGHPARRTSCVPLLRAVRLLNASGTPTNQFIPGEGMRIEFTVDPLASLHEAQFGIGVDDWMGVRLFSVATYLSDSPRLTVSERCTVTCAIDSLALAPGRYYLSLSAGTMHNTLMDALDRAVSFEVQPTDYYGCGRLAAPSLGKVLVRSRWTSAPLPPPAAH